MNQAETYDSILPFYMIETADSNVVMAEQSEEEDYLLMCNDSLFARHTDDTTIYRESMFAWNTHSTQSVTPLPREHDSNEDWMFGVIVLLLAIMSLYINSRKFKLKDIFLSLFDIRVMERIARESNIKSWSMLPMVGIYLADLSVIAIDLTRQQTYLHSGASAVVQYLIILGILTAFITLKNGFIHLLGNIFEDKSSTSLYIANSHLFHFVGALALTPVLLLILYGTGISKAATTAAIIIILTTFIIRLFRGFQLILTNSKTSKLYLFYYLCILEIVPILVAAKILLF